MQGNVKLCDFGWAVNKKEELRSTFCGTPLYLSPELLQGERYDEKVDLWAVGVLAYELVFGASPFNINEQGDLVKIVTRWLARLPTRLSSPAQERFPRSTASSSLLSLRRTRRNAWPARICWHSILSGSIGIWRLARNCVSDCLFLMLGNYIEG
jgi:serine/threonine protein kinase